MNIKRILSLITTLYLATALCGCSLFEEESTRWHHPVNETTEGETADPNATGYMGIVTAIDDIGCIITIRAVSDGNQISYKYNSSTEFTNKYDKYITASQLDPGDVVDIEYQSGTNVLTSIGISKDEDVWTNTKVTNFEVDTVNKSFKIGQTNYSYDSFTAVFSGEKQIDIKELTEVDELTVWGRGSKILSIVLNKGHGYISLTGDTLFIGGYITVGDDVVKVIEENMLILVGEGTQRVEVRNGLYLSEKEVTVERDSQVIVDFSDVEPIVATTGMVSFDVNVDDATIYVDGIARDDEIITLEVGEHRLLITADGYLDYEENFNVNDGYEKIEITMTSEETEEETDDDDDDETEEETETDEEETETEEEVVTNSDGDVVSQINDVTISGPVGGYVYFDGKYKGVAPVTFDMILGTHVISILYNSEINSYTVTLAEGADDVDYDFSANWE